MDSSEFDWPCKDSEICQKESTLEETVQMISPKVATLKASLKVVAGANGTHLRQSYLNKVIS